jgi:phosphonate degradation associated HDIG domain protein
MSIISEIEDLFARRGGSLYGGEAVTQQEHALQAAWLAEKSDANATLITASLLHDIGHLLHNLPDSAPDSGINDQHEELGVRWLARHFAAGVTEPVRLHVTAKRYLCAVESDYLAAISPASAQSLELQGGPLSPDEVQSFESSPFLRDAVNLRRWDDEAKKVGLPTPDLAHFLSYTDAILADSN